MSSTLRKALKQTADALAYVATSLAEGSQRNAAEDAVADARAVLEADQMMDWLADQVANDIPPRPAALSAPEQDDGWLPIVSAPKEHSPILVWSLAGGCSVSFLDATWAWWSIPNGDGPMQDAPTHWRPLPASPGATP